MASQLEVVKFRDIVPLSTISQLVPGFELPTIEIKGKDFRSVEKVLINSSPSPEFIIIDKNTIYAQLPAAATSVRSIEVVSFKFTTTVDSSRLSFELGDKTRLVSGIQKLTQLFVKWLLQSPGSDIFNPDRGGGLQDIVGKITSTRRMGPVLSTISRAVSTTTSQIRLAQTNVPGLPLDERLLSTEILDLQAYDQQAEARARIKILSVAGPEAVTSLGL